MHARHVGLREMTARQIGVVVFAVMVLTGSFSPILIRWSGVPDTTKVFFRLLLTTAMVAPVALWYDRAAFGRISARDLLLSLVTGVVLGAHFLLFFRAVDWTTVAAATVIGQTHVMFVPLAAYALLDERVTRGMVAGIVVALAGDVLLATGVAVAGHIFAGERPELDNVSALFGAVMFASYTVAGRSVRQRLPLFPYVTIVYGMATLAVGAVGVGTGVPLARVWPPSEWLLFLAMALDPGIGTHTLLNWALEYVDSTVVVTSYLAIPVGSTVLAFALLGEVPTAATVLGAALVLAGLYVTVRTTPEGALDV